ncbi:ATP-binding cassette domain-containing protein [Nocardioides sp. LMS-CY]|uniref:ABC-type branched-subunit amino acid transport system ATPase component n=1 Tax=Nocardioides soli TaxID=1036020 RepID=A0A7W4Z2B7_9ACTN|nr:MULTISPECIES: ABC transporter ATP-binding protein [Nocardioides]MBB3043727.1 ABC-type branched-subunit amino acid transport system ATPase component [Nocardioides soli]QWF20784.1 ATP-binding cassette domain-containing protein [Nocardioides sp. LMS-CY]
MLRAEGVSVHYGGVRAVDGVDAHLDEGELLGLIGPNGSGKSTLLNALCGVVAASGKVRIDGRPMPLGSPAAARRNGIARVFQVPQTYPELSALENVVVGSHEQGLVGVAGAWFRRRAMWRLERSRCREAMETLEMLGLADVAAAPAESLSYGQRRLVDLARAMVAQPRLVLLDEPSAGLNDSETEHLGGLLRTINRDLPMVLVDHKMGLITSLCHRVTVLDTGTVVADGPPGEVLADPAVIRAYLGGPVDAES